MHMKHLQCPQLFKGYKTELTCILPYKNLESKIT